MTASQVDTLVESWSTKEAQLLILASSAAVHDAGSVWRAGAAPSEPGDGIYRDDTRCFPVAGSVTLQARSRRGARGRTSGGAKYDVLQINIQLTNCHRLGTLDKGW